MARWLVWQVGYRRHVELQVSVASTAQAEAARHSYTAMGMRALRNRERSRVVTAPDAGHRIWRTPEYSVTSGWTPIPHRDTQVHGQWSTLTEGQQQALVHTTMRVHGYSEDTARRHFTGSNAEDEATVLLIVHDIDASPPPPLTPTPPLHGRMARRGRVGLRRPPEGVMRPRRQRDTTSRYNAVTLRAVERALRGATDADGDSSGVT